MTTYRIRLDDNSETVVEAADAYRLEGPFTTFFRTRDATGVIDSWSLRLASFRTASVLSIRRSDTAALTAA